MKLRLNPGVMPAQAGIHASGRRMSWKLAWVPAFAGMTSHLGRASRALRPSIPFAFALLCALVVSACGEMRRSERERDAAAVGLSNAEVRHPIGFAPKSEGLEVEVPAGAEGLSPNQQVDVFRFLHRYKREADGRLVITVPTGVRDKAAVAQSVQEIQRQVAEAGIDYRLLNGRPHDARSGGTPAIRLAYQRPVAVPPPCNDNDWTRDVGRNEERMPYPNWGCATQHNLAVTVDNARDLGQPQAEDPRSGERRSVSWSGYVGGSAASGSDGAAADTAKKASSARK